MYIVPALIIPYTSSIYLLVDLKSLNDYIIIKIECAIPRFMFDIPSFIALPLTVVNGTANI